MRVTADLDGLNALDEAARLGDVAIWDERLEAASLPALDGPLLDGPLLDGALRLLAEGTGEGPSARSWGPSSTSIPSTGAGPSPPCARGPSGGCSRDRQPAPPRLGRVGGRGAGALRGGRLRRPGGAGRRADRAPAALPDDALALRAKAGDGSELVEAGERELRRMRRAGFEAGRPALATAVATVDGALANVSLELDAHGEALAGLAATEVLDARLARDRAAFSNTFAALSLGLEGPAPLRRS